MIYGQFGSKVLIENIDVPEQGRKRLCLSDDDVLRLAGQAITIENHYYSKKAGKDRPMDIEWAKDGLSGELFIV